MMVCRPKTGFGRICTTLVVVLAVLFAPVVSPVMGVEPNEVLKDPKLEARARALSAGLRCLVCQNQSIDDSNAHLARDLRILVRERLKRGDSDAQVLDYIVARYGEFVLLKPRFGLHTILLWATPLLILLAAGLFVWWRTTLEAPNRPTDKLKPEEEAALKRLLER